MSNHCPLDTIETARGAILSDPMRDAGGPVAVQVSTTRRVDKTGISYVIAGYSKSSRKILIYATEIMAEMGYLVASVRLPTHLTSSILQTSFSSWR